MKIDWGKAFTTAYQSMMAIEIAGRNPDDMMVIMCGNCRTYIATEKIDCYFTCPMCKTIMKKEIKDNGLNVITLIGSQV